MADSQFKLNYPVSTELQFKFWGSDHKCNRLKAIIAYSLNLNNANDNLGRFGYPFHFRKRALKAFGNYVNHHDFADVEFSPVHDTTLGRDLYYYEELDRVWGKSGPKPSVSSFTIGNLSSLVVGSLVHYPNIAVIPLDAEYQSISWNSSDTDVADGEQPSGQVAQLRLKKAGTFTLTATITNKDATTVTATKSFTVVAQTVPVAFTLNKSTIVGSVGQNVVATITGGSGTYHVKVTNGSIIADDYTGASPYTYNYETVDGTGTFTIEISDSADATNKASKTFTVSVPAADTYYIKLLDASTGGNVLPGTNGAYTLAMKKGDPVVNLTVQKFKNGVVVSGGGDNFTFTGGDTSVATVAKGTNAHTANINDVGAGSTTWTFHSADGLATATLTITVTEAAVVPVITPKAAPTDFKVNDADLSSTDLFSVVPANTPMTLAVDASGHATIVSGKLHAVSAGDVVVTASATGATAKTLTVTVKANVPAAVPATAYLPASGYDVYIGGINPLPPFKLIPATATGQTHTWDFADKAAATAHGWVITGDNVMIPAKKPDGSDNTDDNFDIKLILKNADGSVVPVDSSESEDQTMHCYHTPTVDTLAITDSADGDNSIAVGAHATIKLDVPTWNKESNFEYTLDGTDVDTSSFLTTEFVSDDPLTATVDKTTGVITGVKTGDTRIRVVVKWHGNVLWTGTDSRGSSAINVK